MGSALALPIFIFVKSNYFVELSCASIFAAASPIARACFFPLNRISARVRLPSEFFFTTAESYCEDWFRSTTRPVVLATTLLPCRMLTSTFEPCHPTRLCSHRPEAAGHLP